MEALGDAVGFGKAPHSDNRLEPGAERRGQGFGRALVKLLEERQEAQQDLFGAFGIQGLHQQEAHQALLGRVEGLEHRTLLQILRKRCESPILQ